MDSFCDTELWNVSVTWNTDNPDFTPCFEKTVLAWVPCLFLWIFSPLEVFYMLSSKQRNIPWSFFNVSKFLLSFLIIVDCLAEFIYALRSSDNQNVYPVDIYSPAVKFLTFCWLLLLQWLNKKRGIQASGLVFLFWFIYIICGAPQLRTIVQKALQEQALPDPSFFFITYCVFYCAVLLSFLLTFFVDPPPLSSDYPHVERLCPEKSSSFPSRLTFNWFTSIAWLGYRTPLEAKHLWSMNHEETSREVVPIFDKYWDALVIKNLKAPDAKTAFIRKADNFDMKTKFTGPRKTKSPPVSILMPMFKAFGPTFFFGAFFYLINTLLTFVSPQLLKLLIAFVSSDEALWKGYAYAALLFVTAVAQTLMMSQYYYRMSLVGLRIRTALVSLIYRKALRVTNTARKESTVGEVVNLMAVDAQRFMDLTTYVNLIWSAPLQIILALYFLWQTLGPSVLAGLAVMVIMVPINGFVANKVKTLQIAQMKNKDERVKLMNEIISGMKILKLYAWESSFEQQILAIREREMIVLKKAAYLNACTSFIWTCAPFLVSLSTFATYVLVDVNNILDSEKAFVSLSLFNILRAPLALLPMMITFLIQAGVSVKRMNKFLNSEELDPNCVQHDQSEDDPIVVENGTFSWGDKEEDATVLRGINLRVKQGSLVAVVGTVGSGKTSLLAGILGEMEKLTGRVNTKGSIAYVPQQAWIQNATLQDNILFGQSHEPAKYSNIIRACALQADLDMLPAGDMTEIGEKGINLSGGQKQRVSLARAVYSNSDVYLLDDPLSAVDSHVGKHIFENVVGPNGLLKNKTRVLVTHAITYLPEVDLIVVLKDGWISESGTYKELLAQKGAFADFLEQYLQEIGDEVDIEVPEEVSQLIESKIELTEKFIRQKSQNSESTRLSLRKRKSSSTSNGLTSKQAVKTTVGKPMDKLIEVEKAETGSVKGRVFMDYIKSIGVALSLVTLLLNTLYQLCSIGSNIWLSVWSDDETTVVNGTQDMGKTDMYLAVYGAFGLGQVITRFICSITLYLGCIYASRGLHIMLLRNVLRSPATFFDVTPIGRILNRFGKDIDILDETLPVNISTMLVMFFSVMAVLVVISYSTPIFIAVVIPIAIIYVFVQRFYIATSRQLKRLESVSRSPIYSHFSESVTGVASIRAYGVQDRFISESEKRVDFNQVCLFPSQVANRWLAVRLETVGNLIILFAALFAVIERGSTNAGLVGLSVSYALQVTQVLNYLVRVTSDVETNIVAVERIKEYGETPQEAAWEVSPGPPPSWPDKGQVQFQNFQVRYREGLDLVLKGISFTVNGGEKVGIVGRTGAGKSSLTLCLFRIIEAAGGQITIDGLDISKLGLHDLRSRITIIPQDPVLFSGTLRMNLDPFNKESDDAVWRALELAHLKHFVKGLNLGLNYMITEGGDNLSVGQRQLVCLGRALLRKTKVLVLDEATAAVDLETDDLIQRTIRSQFSDCTVLTIAHRLNTIMDYDRVIVLDQGLLVEYDSPASFLKNKNSIFYGMAKDANLI